MTRENFPAIALAIGLVIGLVLAQAVGRGPQSEHGLPLLTLLILCEFGLIVNLIGAGLALLRLRRGPGRMAPVLIAIGCVALSIGFLVLGVRLWPSGGF